MAITMIAKLANIAGFAKKYFTESHSKIGEIIIDCSQVETIDYVNTITDHPVEFGYSISDHVYNNPLKIKIEGFVNDDAVDILGSVKNAIGLFKGDFIKNVTDLYKGKGRKQLTAYETLVNLHQNRTLVDIVAYLDTFNNMIIETLTFPRDNKTGNRLMFVATLKQITIAQVENVVITNNPKKTQDLISKKSELGTQPVLKATDAEKKEVIKAGILKNIKDNIFGK